MGFFRKKQEDDLSLPRNRRLDLNPSRQELEWIEAVNLWEDEYWSIHNQHGWKTIKGKGFRETSDRFTPVHWKVGEVTVIAEFDSRSGIVTERVIG